jgi:hypothetical protein
LAGSQPLSTGSMTTQPTRALPPATIVSAGPVGPVTSSSGSLQAGAAPPRLPASLVAGGGSSSNSGCIGGDTGLAQNALLKQLLSSSTVAPKSSGTSSGGVTDTSPVKTGSSTGAMEPRGEETVPSEVDRFKHLPPQQVLSNMASQLPNPQASPGLETATQGASGAASVQAGVNILV